MCDDHVEGPATAKAMPGMTWSPATAELEAALSSMTMVIVTGVLELGAVTGRVPRPVTR